MTCAPAPPPAVAPPCRHGRAVRRPAMRRRGLRHPRAQGDTGPAPQVTGLHPTAVVPHGAAQAHRRPARRDRRRHRGAPKHRPRPPGRGLHRPCRPRNGTQRSDPPRDGIKARRALPAGHRARAFQTASASVVNANLSDNRGGQRIGHAPRRPRSLRHPTAALIDNPGALRRARTAAPSRSRSAPQRTMPDRSHPKDRIPPACPSASSTPAPTQPAPRRRGACGNRGGQRIGHAPRHPRSLRHPTAALVACHRRFRRPRTGAPVTVTLRTGGDDAEMPSPHRGHPAGRPVRRTRPTGHAPGAPRQAARARPTARPVNPWECLNNS